MPFLQEIISLTGVDFTLLQTSGRSAIQRHYYTGLLLIAIFVVLLFSSFQFLRLMLNKSTFIPFAIACFISLLFIAIYIFILTTFSKKKKRTHLFQLNLSNTIRIGFIILISFFATQPINILIFSSQLGQEIKAHQFKVQQEHERLIDSIFSHDLSILENRIEYLTSQEDLNRSSSLVIEREECNTSIAHLKAKRQDLVFASRQRISQGTFLLYRIQTCLLHHPSSWLILLLLMSLFLLPGYLIYTIPDDDVYYHIKHQKDLTLIIAEYSHFCQTHYEIFRNTYSLDTAIYSRFEDPPFNTIRTASLPPRTHQDFIEKFRHL